jgi:hypothetical protein
MHDTAQNAPAARRRRGDGTATALSAPISLCERTEAVNTPSHSHNDSIFGIQRLLPMSSPYSYASTKESPLKEISNSDLASPLHSKRKHNDSSSLSISKKPLALESAPASAQDTLIAYIPGEIQYFWQCPNCSALPLFKRLKYSVVFYGGNVPPTAKEQPLIASHWKECAKTSKGCWLRSCRPRSLVDRHADEDDSSSSLSELLEDVTSKNNNFKNLPQSVLPSRPSSSVIDEYDEKNPLDASIVKTALSMATASSSSSSFSREPLVIPQQDRYKTAVIDILILSQLSKCHYTSQADCNKTKRSYELPENFPGIQCQYCIPTILSSSDAASTTPTSTSEAAAITKIRNGRWFCRNPEQLSNTMGKIQHHLMNCRYCPLEIKQTLFLAKAHEPMERKALECQWGGGQKASRTQYCALVFQRLDAHVL